MLTVTINNKVYKIHRPSDRDTKIRTAPHNAVPWWMFVWNSGIVMAHKLHELPTPLKLLDVGCGLGLTAMVAQQLGHHTYVTDMFVESYDYVRRNCEVNEIHPPRWVDAIADIPLGSLDCVTMCDVLYNQDQSTERTIETALRAIKPGGFLMIAEPTRLTETLLLRRFDVFNRHYTKETIKLEHTVDLSEVKDDYTTINIYTFRV